VVGVPVSATVADLATASLASGYSRLPVYGGDLDDVLGVALAKDVLRVAPEARATTPVTELMQPVPAVPVTARLDTLLSEMRATGKQLVLVVDEYGGTTGILTLEDLLEEIVGEIEDEHDAPELTAPAPAGLTVLDGGLNLDELAETVGLHLPEGDYETLAGFLLAQLDRIPEVGDEVVWRGWRFEVLEMERRRVARVVVHPPPDAGPPDDRPSTGPGEPGEPDEPAEPRETSR
jgi:CBS domain containing-hemolysin-like protein